MRSESDAIVHHLYPVPAAELHAIIDALRASSDFADAEDQEFLSAVIDEIVEIAEQAYPGEDNGPAPEESEGAGAGKGTRSPIASGMSKLKAIVSGSKGKASASKNEPSEEALTGATFNPKLHSRPPRKV